MTLQDDRPDAVTVARAARALIENRDRWTTGSYARTAIGTKCAPDDPRAARWCAIGARVARVARGAADREASDAVDVALRRAAHELWADGSPATVNDRRGHAAVLAMYDRAIELLEREAAAA
jgi:hypothetical protein